MTKKYGKLLFSIAGRCADSFFIKSCVWQTPSLAKSGKNSLKKRSPLADLLRTLAEFQLATAATFSTRRTASSSTRFTIQPEFNVDMAEWAKFFISWRFVAEPRYSMETKSREASVTFISSQPVRPLIITYYSSTARFPGKRFWTFLQRIG